MTASADDQFSNLPLAAAQLANLQKLGYATMTPIQAASLPLMLNGADVIGRAKTGSGKTAAFGLSLLQRLEPRQFNVQALVLCPTRELADQVGKELRRLARAVANIKLTLLVGGKPIGPQIGSLEHGTHIVVGTPGRVMDHLRKGTLNLKALRTLILDEADRMLDMGFVEATRSIASAAPRKRQTLLFSATYPDEIRALSQSIQRDPKMVSVASEHAPEVIEQVFYEVSKHERNNTLLAIFEHYQPTSALVFCQTRKQCAEVAALLSENRIEAAAIHGDLEQRQRDQVLAQFANKSCPVLVATDVAARGLDIESLDLVVNYELPREAEVYTHRIGRTGRAGETGRALSLFTESEQYRVNMIAEVTAEPLIYDVAESLDRNPDYQLSAAMQTLQIDAGRKQKLRPGDVLGALTGEAGLPGSAIGKIEILDMCTYVGVERSAVRKALAYLSNGRVKGRPVKARKVRL